MSIDHDATMQRCAVDHVALEPLGPAHAARPASGDGRWRTVAALVHQRPRAEAVDDYVAAALRMQAAGRPWPSPCATPAGDRRHHALLRHRPSVPRLSIGYTWYARRVHRTGLNTEAKLLLLGHAFEALGCIAVALETSWFNHASRAAIARLGAKQDGVLRNHRRHADGSVRDTVVFSILDASGRR